MALGGSGNLAGPRGSHRRRHRRVPTLTWSARSRCTAMPRAACRMTPPGSSSARNACAASWRRARPTTGPSLGPSSRCAAASRRCEPRTSASKRTRRDHPAGRPHGPRHARWLGRAARDGPQLRHRPRLVPGGAGLTACAEPDAVATWRSRPTKRARCPATGPAMDGERQTVLLLPVGWPKTRFIVRRHAWRFSNKRARR